MDNGLIQRPTMLYFEQIKHSPQCHEAYNFIREASSVWNSSSSVHDLFYELGFTPTDEQIADMMRNAARLCTPTARLKGLTLGDFLLLAAEYRKFSPKTSQNGNSPFQITSLSPKSSSRVKKQIFNEQKQNSSISITKEINEESKVEAPEVFLGGSCNPTTWRADVAMPELKKLGISFFNPQVSQWTPDLIQLEHRAKQKARVLFFVIDSETRASAGAIEVAHLSGQNQKPLILVLHPYNRNQKILHESISEEEFLDLSRNQRLLRQLVTRRGIRVHDNIMKGLQVIKDILAGEGPYNFPKSWGSQLISVRKSYDRVVNNESGLTLKQCNQQLLSLGYRRDLVSSENLKRILSLIRNELNIRNELTHLNSTESSLFSQSSSSSSSSDILEINWDMPSITFEEFCIISAYLSVLQLEIEENTCVSPIKGTNLPPPPIYLTNTPEVYNLYNKQCSQTEENHTIVGICPPHQRHILSSRSFTIEGSVVMAKNESVLMMSNGSRSDSSRDSGTSSPQPNEGNRLLNGSSGSSLNSKMSNCYRRSDSSRNVLDDEYNDIDSDSNDSVFSTSSSLDDDLMHEIRDIYLGGSCMLRTKWRQEIAIPYLESKNITYFLPKIQESLKLRESKGCKDNASGGYRLEEAKTDEPLMFSPRILDSSRVLLFIISNETRSLAPMTLAAHYIGLAYNVVLCIQMLPENCTIGNDKLTSQAVKDYNRGRAYLRDLAERQNIPVFSEIKEALECAVEKVKLSKPRCSV